MANNRRNQSPAAQGQTRGAQLAQEAAAAQQQQAKQAPDFNNGPPPAVQEAQQPAQSARPKSLFVMDRTAKPDRLSSDGQVRIPGFREHEMPVNGTVKVVRFEYAKPTKLPWAVAIKFLKHGEPFVLTDEEGNEKTWQATPRQPEDFQAGEKFRLQDNEVVARLDEITTDALRIRCAMLPGGDEAAETYPRDKLIEFMLQRTVELRIERESQEPDVDRDSYVPDPESEDEANFFAEAS